MEDKLVILDRDTVLEISYEDMIKYHGRFSIAGVALAFKALALAFSRLVPEGIPARDKVSFFSGIGPAGKGVIDGVEMVTRAKSRGQLTADIARAEGKPGPAAPEGGKYYFEVAYGDRKAGLSLKEGLIPEEFMVLSRKALSGKFSAEEAKRLQQVKEQIAVVVMSNKAADLFDFILIN